MLPCVLLNKSPAPTTARYRSHQARPTTNSGIAGTSWAWKIRSLSNKSCKCFWRIPRAHNWWIINQIKSIRLSIRMILYISQMKRPSRYLRQNWKAAIVWAYSIIPREWSSLKLLKHGEISWKRRTPRDRSASARSPPQDRRMRDIGTTIRPIILQRRPRTPTATLRNKT